MPNDQSYEQFKAQFLQDRQNVQSQRNTNLDALNNTPAVKAANKQYVFDPTDPTKVLSVDVPNTSYLSGIGNILGGNTIPSLTPTPDTTQASPLTQQDIMDTLKAFQDEQSKANQPTPTTSKSSQPIGKTLGQVTKKAELPAASAIFPPLGLAMETRDLIKSPGKYKDALSKIKNSQFIKDFISGFKGQ